MFTDVFIYCRKGIIFPFCFIFKTWDTLYIGRTLPFSDELSGHWPHCWAADRTNSFGVWSRNHRGATKKRYVSAKTTVQKCRWRLTVKKFSGISNLTISAVLHRILASEELLNLNLLVPMFSKTLDITMPYNLLMYKNISKVFNRKAKATSKTQHFLSIHKEFVIYFNFWTKFPINKRQLSKPLKYIRQPSKLEKN